MAHVPISQNNTLSVLGGNLDNCIIRKAYTGIKTEATSLTLENCVIENSLQYGIEADLATNQSLHLHDCSVSNNRAHGLLARGTDGQYTVYISKCTFKSNRNTGVYIERGNLRLSMFQSRLENNRQNLKLYPHFGVIEMHGCFFGPHSNTYNYWTADIRMGNYYDFKVSMLRQNRKPLIIGIFRNLAIINSNIDLYNTCIG